MRKLTVFSQMTIDGYFAGVNGDISWAHADSNDTEHQAFVGENAKGGGVMLFGRITYELMASYWPTPLALKNDPVVAEGMNRMEKVVFSRTLDKVLWSNTRLVKGDLATEVRKMKQEAGKDVAILGSGSIVSQLAQEGLVDEFQLLVYPIVLGQGRKLFDGVKARLNLKLTKTRTFGNGNVFLCYAPKK